MGTGSLGRRRAGLCQRFPREKGEMGSIATTGGTDNRGSRPHFDRHRGKSEKPAVPFPPRNRQIQFLATSDAFAPLRWKLIKSALPTVLTACATASVTQRS